MSTTKTLAIIELIKSACSPQDAEIISVSLNKMLLSTIEDMNAHSLFEEHSQTQQVKEAFDSLYKESVAAFESKVSRMIRPASPVAISLDNFVAEGFSAHTSAMGQGKTTSVMNPSFAKARANGEFPIHLAPSIALLSQYANSDDHYQNFDSTKFGLYSTPDSVQKTSFSEVVANCKSIQIDEVIKYFEHTNGNAFLSGDMKSKASAVAFLRKMASQANRMTFSDALLGQEWIDVLSGIVGREITAFDTMNSSYEKVSVSYGATKNNAIEEAVNLINEGKHTFIKFDGKIEEMTAIFESIKKQCPGKKGLFIDSAAASVLGSDANLGQTKPETLDSFDFVLASPCLGPGFSCISSLYKDVVIIACGTESPYACIQSAMRFRNVENVTIAFDINSRKRQIGSENIAFDLSFREFDGNSDNLLSDATIRAKAFLSTKDGQAVCKILELENFARNNYARFVIKAMEILGFRVSRFVDKEASVAVKDAVKLSKEEVRQAKREFFAHNPVASFEDKKLMKEEMNNLNMEDKWAVEQSEAAEVLMKREFNEADIDFILEENGINIVRTLRNMGKTKHATRFDELKAVLSKDVYDFAMKGEFNEQSFKEFIVKMSKEKESHRGSKIRKITLLTTVAFDIKTGAKPYITVKNILAQLGFSLSKNKNSNAYECNSKTFNTASQHACF